MPAPAPADGNPLPRAAAIFAMLALPAALSWLPLASYWARDPQYRYGWLIPPLFTLLVIRRLRAAPPPGAAKRWGQWMLAAALVSFLPLWLVLQPSPDWRPLPWLSTTAAVIGILGLAAAHGGSRLARHLGFPAIFLFAAAPWPLAIEWGVTQALMQSAVTLATNFLDMTGVPAIARGNVVETARGVVDMDAACSGIRSLQPSLAMALFLGEMLLLTAPRRAALVAASACIAWLTNAGRILFLILAAHHGGTQAIDRWHDSAGLLVMTACFILIWPTALFLARATQTSAAAADAIRIPRTPRLLIIPSWVFGVLIAVELWFSNDQAEPARPWTFQPPAGARGLALDPSTASMLGQDEAHAWEWVDAGRQCLFYDLRWIPGPARRRLLIAMHRPEVCLPAAGWQLLADRGTVWLRLEPESLPFRAYRFAGSGRVLHVYFLVLRSGQPSPESSAGVRRACFEAVAERRRTFDQQLLELAFTDSGDDAQADAIAADILARTLKR